MTLHEREQQRSEDRAVLSRLRRDAALLSERFGLTLGALDSESARVKRRYGICYEDGSIRIRLRHATTGRPLKYSALIDTLCHELAHLRHFDHGRRFEALYLRILAYARRNGIYRPSPRPRFTATESIAPEHRPAPAAPPRGPLQLELFSSG